MTTDDIAERQVSDVIAVQAEEASDSTPEIHVNQVPPLPGRIRENEGVSAKSACDAVGRPGRFFDSQLHVAGVGNRRDLANL